MENQCSRKTPLFTKSYVAAAPKLIEAGVSARERVLYDGMTRWHSKDYVVSRPRKELVAETGLKENNLDRLVKSLRSREFSWDGKKVPVIDLVCSGRRGQTSAYRDNLTAWAVTQADVFAALENGMRNHRRGKVLLFKKSYAAAIPKLIEAKVSAHERVVYDVLTIMSEEDKNGGYAISRPLKEIAAATGLTEGNVRVLVCRLTERRFFWNGVAIPVIDRLYSGRRGQTSGYRDNLTAWVYNQGEEPLTFLRKLDSNG
jgi:hypothetical protein